MEDKIFQANDRYVKHDMRNIAGAEHDAVAPSRLDRILAWRAVNVANLPSLSGELFAMFREAVKDIRQTFNEVMMGHHEHAPEPGAPLNPTQIMTTDDLRPDSFNHQELYSYEHGLATSPGRARDQDRGIER